MTADEPECPPPPPGPTATDEATAVRPPALDIIPLMPEERAGREAGRAEYSSSSASGTGRGRGRGRGGGAAARRRAGRGRGRAASAARGGAAASGGPPRAAGLRRRRPWSAAPAAAAASAERPRAWAPVFCVLTFDNWLHGFAGRTEGAVAVEDAAFRLDLAPRAPSSTTPRARPSPSRCARAQPRACSGSRPGASCSCARATARTRSSGRARFAGRSRSGGFVAADRADVCTRRRTPAPPTGPSRSYKNAPSRPVDRSTGGCAWVLPGNEERGRRRTHRLALGSAAARRAEMRASSFCSASSSSLDW